MAYWMQAAQLAMQAYEMSKNKSSGANKEDPGGGNFNLPQAIPDYSQYTADDELGVVAQDLMQQLFSQQAPTGSGFEQPPTAGASPAQSGAFSQDAYGLLGSSGTEAQGSGSVSPTTQPVGQSPQTFTGMMEQAGGMGSGGLAGVMSGQGSGAQQGSSPAWDNNFGSNDPYGMSAMQHSPVEGTGGTANDYMNYAQMAGGVAQSLSNRTSGAGSSVPAQWNPQQMPQGPQIEQAQLPQQQQGPALANDKSGYIDLLGQLQEQAMGPYYQRPRYPRRQYGY